MCHDLFAWPIDQRLMVAQQTEVQGPVRVPHEMPFRALLAQQGLPALLERPPRRVLKPVPLGQIDSGHVRVAELPEALPKPEEIE